VQARELVELSVRNFEDADLLRTGGRSARDPGQQGEESALSRSVEPDNARFHEADESYYTPAPRSATARETV
jgi:hypothetical protein